MDSFCSDAETISRIFWNSCCQQNSVEASFVHSYLNKDSLILMSNIYLGFCRDIYSELALMMDEDSVSMLSGLMVGLNVLEFNFVHKDEDLDNLVRPILSIISHCKLIPRECARNVSKNDGKKASIAQVGGAHTAKNIHVDLISGIIKFDGTWIYNKMEELKN